MGKKNQRQCVLDYMLEMGGITSWEAIQQFGCTRLSAAIYDLKKAGWQIDGNIVKTKNRYGDPVFFKRYFVVASPAGKRTRRKRA